MRSAVGALAALAVCFGIAWADPPAPQPAQVRVSPSDPGLAGGEPLVAPLVALKGGGPDANEVKNLSTGELFDTIAAALADPDTLAGHTLEVQASYTEGICTVSKAVTIQGKTGSEVVQAGADTGSSGDARGWFLVTVANVTFKKLKFDGSGFNIFQAIRFKEGGALVEDCTFDDIRYAQYLGMAVVGFKNTTVRRCTFTNIERIGVILFGTDVTAGVVEEITYHGKGNVGECLDYGIELGGGAVATLTRNTIEDCTGVASDLSTSAAVLITTYFGAGTAGTLTNNILQFNSGAVAVGYDGADTSSADVYDNYLADNFDYAVGSTSSTVTTDASGNWWGDNTPAVVAGQVGGLVDYTPWLDAGTDTQPGTPGFQGDFSTLWVGAGGQQTGTTGRIREGVVLVSGSVVYVAAGTYNEDNILVDKAVTLEGMGTGLTIIDASTSTNTGSVIDIDITTPGIDVTVTKLTVKPGASLQGISFLSTGATGATITISHNEVDGYGSGANAGWDFGIIGGYNGVASVVVTENTLENNWGNPILFEKHAGISEVSHNTIDLIDESGGIYYMTYDGLDVTALQEIAYNTINMPGPVGCNAVVINSASSWATDRRGKYTDVYIHHNTINGATGWTVLQCREDSANGTDGEIVAPRFHYNTINGGGTGPGIRLAGYVTNADIRNNDIDGQSPSIRLRQSYETPGIIPTGTVVYENALTGYTTVAVDALNGTSCDASANWWDTTTPAGVAAAVSGDVDYTPWLGGGTYFTPGFEGDFTELWVDDSSPQTGTTGRIQEGIDLVTASTVNVEAGTYDEAIVIDKPLELLGDGYATTTIDATSATADVGVYVDEPGGDVTVDGFTIKTKPAPYPNESFAAIARSTSPGTLTFTNNKFQGANNYDSYDFGLYVYNGTTADIVFQYNIVTGTGNNPLLIERATGMTDISYNTIDDGSYGLSCYYLTYGDTDVTALQRFSHNEFNIGVGPEPAAAVTFASAWTGTAGRYSNVEISDNHLYNVDDGDWAVRLSNRDPGDGDAGEISGVLITGNVIEGGGGGGGSIGIWCGGLCSDVDIEGNILTGLGTGMVGAKSLYGDHYPGSVEAHDNYIAGNGQGADWHASAVMLDAEYNNWGSGEGPEDALGSYEVSPEDCGSDPALMINALPAGQLGNAVSENVDYCPWTIDAKLALETLAYCFKPGDEFVVEVQMLEVSTPENIVGGDFFLKYDQARLDFVSAVPGDDPFLVQVYESVDELNGLIDYGVGVTFGDPGTQDETTMARITFTVLAGTNNCSVANLVTFRTHDPPTKLSDYYAEAVYPALYTLPPVAIDEEAPVIAGTVASGTLDADCQVEVPVSVTVTDNCDVSVDDVTFAITKTNCTIVANTVAKVQTSSTIVTISGIVTIEAHDQCTATVTIDVDASDCPGNDATHFTTTGTWTDTTPPVLSGCGDVTVPPEFGTCEASVTLGVTAADNCDTSVPVTYEKWTGAAWVPITNPYTYPSGTTPVRATAADGCGNSSSCQFNVVVESFFDVFIEVEIDSLTEGDVSRCITFEGWDCAGPTTVSSPTVVSFTRLPLGGPYTHSRGTVTIQIPCGLDYDEITARDTLHALRRTVSLSKNLVLGRYEAAFTAAAGKRLNSGNLNDDKWIDILDFGVFSWQWNTAPGANTTCATPYPHADLTGNGTVNAGDFGPIAINYLKGRDGNACGQPGDGEAGPVTAISVDELMKLGLGELAAGDWNGDGWLDAKDIEAFLSTPPAPQKGDLNCDGALNAYDVDPFVLAVNNPAAYAAAYPNCDIRNADVNGDGKVDSFDINPFVELLTGK